MGRSKASSLGNPYASKQCSVCGVQATAVARDMRTLDTVDEYFCNRHVYQWQHKMGWNDTGKPKKVEQEQKIDRTSIEQNRGSQQTLW